MSDIAPTIKLISYPVLLWIFSYTNISHEAVAILTILLVVDVLTAIIRVAITDYKSLSSRTGIIGMLSKLLTFLIPFIVAIVGRGAGVDMTMYVSMSLKVLIIYEGWSVLTNIVQIRKKDKTIGEFDAISMVLNTIQQFFKTVLTSIFQKVPDKNELRYETVEDNKIEL